MDSLQLNSLIDEFEEKDIELLFNLKKADLKSQSRKYHYLLDNIDIQRERLIKSKNNDKEKIAFVGDGINDAPVLKRCDIGISMGGLGSDAAIEASDIVLMNDDPSSIAKAIKISRKTLKIVRQNIIFALAVKLIVLILGALGIANMWEAVFADVGVSFIAILNALRCIKD